MTPSKSLVAALRHHTQRSNVAKVARAEKAVVSAAMWWNKGHNDESQAATDRLQAACRRLRAARSKETGARR